MGQFVSVRYRSASRLVPVSRASSGIGALRRYFPRHAEFGRDHDILAPVAEAFAEIFLGAAALAVDVRGVEQRDAEIERPMHDFSRRRQIDPAAEIVAA
jgi:hypothetical protein